MLSKEEIEKAKEDFNFFNEGDYITKEMSNSKDILLEYIDQIEIDKQKLIEWLEEDNKKDKHTVQVYEEMYRNTTEEFYKKSDKRTIDMANARRETRKEILSILKGGKYANKSKWR